MAILCKYTYDPLGRVSTVTPSAQAVANRFYNGEQLMTELHGDRQRTCIRAGAQWLGEQLMTELHGDRQRTCIRAGAQWLAQQSREGDEAVTI
ncbi:hypothetical protein AO387_03515 [Pseudomonas syringae ICMP 11168]|nr:hypothetical protein AO387_03515 [Pseudomonas syringae ICMP 11168]